MDNAGSRRRGGRFAWPCATQWCYCLLAACTVFCAARGESGEPRDGLSCRGTMREHERACVTFRVESLWVARTRTHSVVAARARSQCGAPERQASRDVVVARTAECSPKRADCTSDFMCTSKQCLPLALLPNYVWFCRRAVSQTRGDGVYFVLFQQSMYVRAGSLCLS